METIKNTRMKNLKQWTDKHGVPAKEKSYFSQVLNGLPIGERAARRIEEQYKMGNGYLDTALNEHSKSVGPSGNFTIHKYKEVKASMGAGIVMQDQPGEIENIEVNSDWYSKNIPANSGKDNLCIVTGFGDSMLGLYNPGDPLLVDVGITDCNHDGVYFFRVGEKGYIKRLQRIPEVGIRVISKNPDYETWTITEKMDFQVLAKVLMVWERKIF